CTNQGLLVTAATIYMSIVGPEGLERVAGQCIANTDELVDALTKIKGVKLAFDVPRFHEAVLVLDKPVAAVLESLAAKGIAGGYDLSKHYSELGNALLVCATETRTSEDVQRYANELTTILNSM